MKWQAVFTSLAIIVSGTICGQADAGPPQVRQDGGRGSMGYSTWPVPNATKVKKYRRAAQKNLAAKYANGQGVPQNYAEAYVWSSIAVLSGNMRAIGNRDLAASQLSSEELSAAQIRATKLLAEIQLEMTGNNSRGTNLRSN